MQIASHPGSVPNLTPSLQQRCNQQSTRWLVLTAKVVRLYMAIDTLLSGIAIPRLWCGFKPRGTSLACKKFQSLLGTL
jgi:hypothetical protein